jgi:hypothetical protein
MAGAFHAMELAAYCRRRNSATAVATADNSQGGAFNIEDFELDRKRDGHLRRGYLPAAASTAPNVERFVWAEWPKMSVTAVLRIAVHTRKITRARVARGSVPPRALIYRLSNRTPSRAAIRNAGVTGAYIHKS